MARRPGNSERGDRPGGAGPDDLRRDDPRPNAPKFRPNKPKGTTFKKPALGLFTTTLWEYPSQHYTPSRGAQGGATRPGFQGDPNYAGATPSWVIWQLLRRYTAPGERVLDPMCGSGTTLDVCADLGRSGRGFDIAPARPDVERADARRLPLPDASCDFVFLDPPYSTHIRYSDDPACIGKLDAGGPDHGRAYYEAMEAVVAEAARVLRPRRYLGLYVSDSWRKEEKKRARDGETERAGPAHAPGEFMPIGFELFGMMRRVLEPVDVVAVVRQNAKLRRGKWHEAAAEENFFLRGFNYLFIMQKAERRNAGITAGTPRPQRSERGGAERRGPARRKR